MMAIIAIAASAPAVRIDRVRGSSSEARRWPIQAPMSEAATAERKPKIAPSGNRLALQWIGIQRFDQAHSEASPTVPMPTPQARPKRTAFSRGTLKRDHLDDDRRDDEQGEVGGGFPEDRPDGDRDRAADQEEERDGGERRAAPEPHPRRGQGDAGGEHDEDRAEDEAELRNAEVELGLEGREPEQQGATERRAA